MEFSSFKKFIKDNNIDRETIKKALIANENKGVSLFSSIGTKTTGIVTSENLKHRSSFGVNKEGHVRDTFCTCKKGKDCEHVVALILFANKYPTKDVEEVMDEMEVPQESAKKKTKVKDEVKEEDKGIKKEESIVEIEGPYLTKEEREENEKATILKAYPISEKDAIYYKDVLSDAVREFNNCTYSYVQKMEDQFESNINPIFTDATKEQQKYLLSALFFCFQKADYYYLDNVEKTFVKQIEDLIEIANLDEKEIYSLLKNLFDNATNDSITLERMCSLLTLFKGRDFETAVKTACLDSKLCSANSMLYEIIKKSSLFSLLNPTSKTPRAFTLLLMKIAPQRANFFSSSVMGAFVDSCVKSYPNDIPLLENVYNFYYSNGQAISIASSINLIIALKEHPDIPDDKWDRFVYETYLRIEDFEYYIKLRPSIPEAVVSKIKNIPNHRPKMETFISIYETGLCPKGLSVTYFSFKDLSAFADRFPVEWQRKLAKRAMSRIDKLFTLLNPHPDFSYCLLILDKISPNTVKGYFSLPKMLNEALRYSFNARVFFNLAEKYNMIGELGLHEYGGRK